MMFKPKSVMPTSNPRTQLKESLEKSRFQSLVPKIGLGVGISSIPTTDERLPTNFGTKKKSRNSSYLKQNPEISISTNFRLLLKIDDTQLQIQDTQLQIRELKSKESPKKV